MLWGKDGLGLLGNSEFNVESAEWWGCPKSTRV